MKVTIGVELVWQATPFAERERVCNSTSCTDCNVDEGRFVLDSYSYLS